MGELVAPKPEDLPGGRARREQMKQEVLDALFGVEPQRTVGRYRLDSLIGAGAMGLVYLARDDELDRSVAIKVLTTGAGGLAEEPSERGKRIARVLREAQAMASLNHPNVVRVFDVGFSDDTPYIVMEYVEGPTLSRWMRTAERTPAEVLRVFVEAGRGLAAAHALGMVHRDFKPSNVLLDPDGHARVTDFGLARTSATDLVSAENSGPSGPLEASLTGAGMVIGTPAYMAPEQHVGHAVTAAADQYAFCVALFEALHGWRPFDAPNYRALVAQKRTGAVSRPSPTPRAIAAIDRVIERGLSPKPEDRWPSMQALLRALQPRRQRRVAAWVGAAAVILGAAAIGGTSSPSPCTDLEASTIAWSDSMPIRGQVDDATWARLDGAITDAIAGWRATVEEVCASEADAPPDVQVACLTEHREHVASTIAALNAIEGVGEQSLVVASSLPGAHRCVEVDPETEPSPPLPANAARLRELQDDLVRARARTVAMSDRTDLDTAGQLVARAREIGYAPTLAAALRERSACETALGQVEAAVASAEEAYFVALRANALREALRAAIVLINLVGAHAADPEGGRTWEQHARALLQRVHEPALEAALLRAVGHIEWQAGRYAEAKVEYERALAILRGDPTSSVMEQAQLLHNVGDAEETLGNAAAARAKFREVMAIEAEVLGEDHVQVARTEGGIGLGYLAEGRYDEAVAILARTAAAHERAYGAHHPEVARWLANLGSTRLGAGRYAEARADLQRAISIYEETDHLDLPMHRLNLAMVENSLGHRDEARALLEQVIDELEREHAHDTHLAMALNNLGLVESDSGRFDAALRHHERALTLKIAALGEHPSVAKSHNNVALALIELERYPEARAHLRAALRIVESGVSVPMDFEPQLRRLLGDVALREGDAVLARTELDAASRLAEACSNHACAEEREKLAEVRRRLAARSRARARAGGA